MLAAQYQSYAKRIVKCINVTVPVQLIYIQLSLEDKMKYNRCLDRTKFAMQSVNLEAGFRKANDQLFNGAFEVIQPLFNPSISLDFSSTP